MVTQISLQVERSLHSFKHGRFNTIGGEVVHWADVGLVILGLFIGVHIYRIG